MSCEENSKSAATNVFDLSLPCRTGIEIRDLSVRLQSKTSYKVFKKAKSIITGKYTDEEPSQRPILDNLSATIACGTLTAIVGSSGCGKTTLLSVMSGRVVDMELRVEGEITYNGQSHKSRSGNDSRTRIPYVVQDDILIPCLTVEETLEYAAKLRLPLATHRERSERVQKLMVDLGLERCARNTIGDRQHKGCSGGERRRVSVAIQLLTDESLLFLDEPTTGLDAASALQMVKILKRLAERGRTIVMTIHQPRSDIWPLVDNMIVLSRGHTIYSGLTDNCLSHLEKSGFPIPLFVNPFEFILDVSSQCRNHTCNTSDQLDLIDAARQLWSNYDKVPAQTTVTIEKQRSEQNSRLVDLSPKSKRYERLCTVLSRSLTLTGRTWICTVRDRLGVSCSILEAIIMGTLSGCMFYHVGKDLPGIKSRIGAMHTAAGLQSYLVLIFETYRLSIDSQIFDREREEGVSIPLTFVLSRRLSRMFLEDIPVPLIYSTIFYFTAGFRHEIDTFLIFFTIQYLLHVMAVSVAVFCVALNRNFLIASLAANTIFVMQTMAAGFFVNLGDVSLWLRWMKWTSYLFYAFGALCYNEFSDQLYECPVPSMESNTAACAPYSGKVILESLNIPPDWLWRPIVALMALISVVLALSILALHLTHIDKKTTPKVNHNDPELHEHTSPIEPGWTKRRIRVALHRVHLRRTKTYFWSKHGTQKDLVVDVSAEFESAQLHVIMGPSGSGKTTLLNFMAQRSENSSGDNCLVSGTITFDGHKISDSALKSICAYVPQENETMLPTLTVRETLRYAARMRLPQHVPRCEQYKRVERLISSFGLQDCANTMIGDEFTKGISGGEKKRLTIATYVLADPAVLLLDEPTSGLDSATASSIIRMLQSFAKEGRTIIMSIHQPRSEWLGVFKSTLLLKQSGQVMYSGQTASMLDHFQALGFVCPTFQNPADFFLDVTSQEYSNSTSRAAYVESRNHDAGRCPIPTIVDYHSNTIAHAAHFGQLEHHTLNFRIALPLLLHRGVIHLKRQRMIAIGRILQIVGLAIVLTCFFTPLKNGSTSIQSRIGYVQQLGSLFFVGMLNAISIFPTERDLFFREQGDGLYRLEAFVTAYTILEVPSQVMGAILFSMLTVLAVGFPRTIHLLAIVALNAMCVVSCGESLGIALLSIVSHTGLAVTVCCIIMSIFVHITGIIAISMPLFLKAINYVSPLKWMVGNVASFSLRDITFTCGESERLPDGKCPIERGIQVLDLYDLNVDGGKYLWILVALTLGYRFAAYGVLKVKIGSRTPWTTAISKLSSGSATSR